MSNVEGRPRGGDERVCWRLKVCKCLKDEMWKGVVEAARKKSRRKLDGAVGGLAWRSADARTLTTCEAPARAVTLFLHLSFVFPHS